MAVTKRATDHLSVYTMELLAIPLAAECVQEVRPDRLVICSDSCAALMSLNACVSQSRQDVLYEVLRCLYRVKNIVMFLWVPGHVGVEGNDKVHSIAKQAPKHPNVEMELSINKAEAKGLIRTVVKNKWQVLWNRESKGRHLYKIQEQMGSGRSSGPREESVVTRLGLGHTRLNSTLKVVGNHPSGRCDHCQEEMNTREHVLFQCQKYDERK
jgi:ribonuclease HI